MQKSKDIHDLFQSFVRVISSAIDERTPYNLAHTKHMAEWGERFVDYLNEYNLKHGRAVLFDAAHKEELLMSIWLHDIGKLVTPLEIMNKETRLRPDQSEAIKWRLERILLLAEINALKGEICAEEWDKIQRDAQETRILIETMNRAGMITKEMVHAIDKVRGMCYVERDGSACPWLREEEYEALLIKNGTLSHSERDVMESHVIFTDKLLSQIEFTSEFSHVRQWAAAHHEFLNGTGYPNRLSGDQIPYETKIITILDIFEALVADDRPYKPGMPVPKALEILLDMADEGKLDVDLTHLFMESKCWETEQE